MYCESETTSHIRSKKRLGKMWGKTSIFIRSPGSWGAGAPGERRAREKLESPASSPGAELRAQHPGRVNHRAHLAERHVRRQVLHPAVGRQDDALRRYVRQR